MNATLPLRPGILPASITSQRIAVIGCGSIGRRHLQNLVGLGCTQLIAYDPCPSARRQVSDPVSVSVTSGSEDLWQRRPEITLVCTPSNRHTEIARMAVDCGSHVFIEKPVAHSLDGLYELQQSAQRQERITLVGCNMRYHPGPAQIKRWLEDEVIGEVLSARLHTGSYLPGWRPQQDYRASYSASPEWGGAVLDCIHEIDLARWLLGPARRIASVVQPARSLGLTTDGLAEILLQHDGGQVSSIHLNFVQRNYRRSIEVIGSTGSLFWDWQERCSVWYGQNGAVRERISLPERWDINTMYVDELRHFLQSVEDGRPACNPIADAVETLKIALEVKREA